MIDEQDLLQFELLLLEARPRLLSAFGTLDAGGPMTPKDVSAESQELADIAAEALAAVDRALEAARAHRLAQS